MTDFNETLDQETSSSTKTPAFFSPIVVLSYIGNSIWGVLFLLLFFGCVMNGAKMLESLSLDDFMGGLVMLFAVMSAVFVALCVVCIIAVNKMKKGNKNGFTLYAVCNGIWSMLLLYGSGGDWLFIVMALISILFIVLFYQASKKTNTL